MDLYKPTRALYEKLGYETAATLPDYFVPGDARVIYRKIFR
jgi:ribosomal protein S18 acetylase RimI-like enzyme